MLLLCLGFSTAHLPAAGDGRIVKVLTHYLDEQGRHALSPSLYDRDAYQALLRRNPEKRAALRFDIQWKSARRAKELKLRTEVRGTLSTSPVQLETPVSTKRRFAQWSAVKLEGERYRELGEPVAWRVSLWDGAQIIAEQKSFLW
ncbi:MAG: hypothetical protein HY043_15520 [Verrucomicrobia bacterium]|nr:hypothetical protein [Verrucomicrobiota bacterium]